MSKGSSVIVAGSRSITDYAKVERAIVLSGFEVGEVVSGNARGVDKLGERYAVENDLALRTFPAKWDEYGKRAGVKRNRQMVEYADKLVAVWDGRSSGTGNVIELARSAGLDVHVEKY